MLDLRRLLSRYRIEWRDRGSNCSQGFVNIACPLCKNDPSFHLRIHETSLWFYCLRNPKHRGRDLSYLASLLKISPSDLPEASNVPESPFQSDSTSDSPKDIGFAESASASNEVKAYLSSRGFEYPEEAIQKFNLRIAKEGKWAGRVLIPLTVGWIGRSMRSFINPKYLAETTDAGFFVTGGGLTVIIVEGTIDAMKLGVVNSSLRVIAMMGGRVSPALLQYLVSEKLETIILVPDNDVAAPHRIELLSSLRQTCTRALVKSGKLPIDYKDCGEMSEHEVRQWLYTL